MAFQNVRIEHRLALNIPVARINAGIDQFRICDPDAVLVATVEFLPGDPFTHSFVWEQVAGTPVTWITPLNTLTAAYTTANGDDKHFRITSDKGTPVARFDEIVVFGTPTSTLATETTAQLTLTSACRHVSLSFLMEASSIGFIQETTNYRLNWTLPCDTDTLVEYHVQRKPALGPWITFEVVPGGSTRTSVSPNIIDNFRILTVYLDGGQYGSNIIYAPTSGLSGILPLELTAEPTYNVTISTYAVAELTLSTKQLDSVLGTTQTYNVTIPTYAVDDLSLITKDVTHNLPTANIFSITIPTYVVDDLTGGDIGG